MRRRAWVLPLLLLVTSGCVYYNGMYNTKQLAKRARHAERDGRTFDAANLWGQVAVKAESLLARHPRSKYAEEARLLHGTARAKLNDCTGGLPNLEQVMLTSARPTFAEDAAEMVGHCRVILGDAASAATAYGRLTTSSNPARRDLALYTHGQALRLNGEFDAAAAELQLSRHPRARGERAAALAGAGKLGPATTLIDSLLAARDTLAPWLAIAEQVGAHDPAAGTALADRLVDGTWLPASVRGRILIGDGLRLSLRDPAAGAARLEQAAQAAAGSEGSVEARLLLLRRRLREAQSSDSLRAIGGDLEGISEEAGSFTPIVLSLVIQTRRAALAADSVPPGVPLGDLRLFLAGELGRDSIDAPRFAAVQFHRILDQWPESPFAPKALLALIVLEPGQADSLQGRMRLTYASSPYLQLVDGSDSPELTVLEDSLYRFAVSFRPEGAPTGRPRPGAQPNRPRPSGLDNPQ